MILSFATPAGYHIKENNAISHKKTAASKKLTAAAIVL
jgi:hypothetical protein